MKTRSGGNAGRKPRRPMLLVRLPWQLLALLIAALLVATGCTTSGNAQDGAPRVEPENQGLSTGTGVGTPEAANVSGFVKAEGRGLVVNGEPVRLKAVNFSNFYHRKIDGAGLMASSHHAETDFGKVKELGFNSVRFAFDGDWYAEAPEVFWQWLNQNVAWARQHNVRLILDLHTPIGGFWLDPTSDDVSFDIWSDPGVRQQNVELWREIAARYKDEPVIAAYDLLNEPVTLDSTGKQWQDLAQEMVDAVRSVDPNHLLVVGGIYGVEGSYGTKGVDPHFLVDDPNVLYDFHFYEPGKYTHQYASWVEGPVQDGGKYPDPNVILPTGERTLLPQSRISTSALPDGTTDWAEYDSGMVAIEDESAVAAMPLVVAQGGMSGKAYFDTITVTEYGPDGTELRQLVSDQLDSDAAVDWHEWESGDSSDPTARFAREDAGHRDNGSLAIADATKAGTIAGWSNDGHLFKVVPGNQYRIRGYMRGENVAPDGGGSTGITLQLDVYAETPGGAGGGFLERNKAYLEYEMDKHLQFGVDNNVPMSVLEFGVVRQTFEMEGKGGAQWVADMAALLKEKDLSFAYWEYHGAQMGMFFSGTGEHSEANDALQEVLVRELR